MGHNLFCGQVASLLLEHIITPWEQFRSWIFSPELNVNPPQSKLQKSPRVAFSAALRDSGSGDIGPFTTSTPLKYKKIFSNYGNCYNPSTGVFTATVNGVYFFRFSMFNNVSPTPNSVVSLNKNDQLLVSVWDTSGTDSHDMGSNAVVIPLKVGDNVYVELAANRLVFDDGMTYNTFSGFLLFPE
uniref:C1q domain-containing protein n=1 Tax=Oryzias latipes TaxID=8090 RepID=A0A3P9IIA9_ORYLA